MPAKMSGYKSSETFHIYHIFFLFVSIVYRSIYVFHIYTSGNINAYELMETLNNHGWDNDLQRFESVNYFSKCYTYFFHLDKFFMVTSLYHCCEEK